MMIGDSFLRGIRENVEASLTDKFGVYSVVKPGCDIRNLLMSAKSTTENLSHNDAVLICGGSNDLNFDNDESVIEHVIEFIQSNNHTNILLTKVPTRYDLSYYSQVNNEIRSYNDKLRDIVNEHKQVALIEMDFDRKYHTRHGLHLNKLGKLQFTNKITQMVHLILGDKQKQSTGMNNKYRNKGDKSKGDGRTSTQVNKVIKNNEDKIKLTHNAIDENGDEKFNIDENLTTNDNSDDKNEEVSSRQPVNKVTQNGIDENGGGKFNQDDDVTTDDNSDDKNEEVRSRQTINQVIHTQEPEDDEENKCIHKNVISEHTY
jgi:hypothetical protein